MCTFNSKLICSAGVQTFFSQGGAPRQRSEIPHRMIPIPPKVGGSSLGYAYFLHISPLFINTMLLALVIYIQFTGKNRPCGAWTMSQLNCSLVSFYSHSLSWPPLNLFSNCSCRSKQILKELLANLKGIQRNLKWVPCKSKWILKEFRVHLKRSL